MTAARELRVRVLIALATAGLAAGLFGATGLGAVSGLAVERDGFEQLAGSRAPEQAIDTPGVASVEQRTSRWAGSPWFALLVAAVVVAGVVLVGVLVLRTAWRVRWTQRLAAAPRAPPRLLPA